MTLNVFEIPLNGLVLAGGKSLRMGRDKGALQWYGKEQRYYLANLLQTLCRNVFISCRPEQAAGLDKNYSVIQDQFPDAGPSGAILSAFNYKSQCAWLVVACDLPLLDLTTIEYLIGHRDASVAATTFESPHDGLPEPLITIWEPKSFSLLKINAAQGRRCPRKVLLNTEIKLLKPPHPDALLNANTPEDVRRVMEVLESKIID